MSHAEIQPSRGAGGNVLAFCKFVECEEVRWSDHERGHQRLLHPQFVSLPFAGMQ